MRRDIPAYPAKIAGYGYQRLTSLRQDQGVGDAGIGESRFGRKPGRRLNGNCLWLS